MHASAQTEGSVVTLSNHGGSLGRAVKLDYFAATVFSTDDQRATSLSTSFCRA